MTIHRPHHPGEPVRVRRDALRMHLRGLVRDLERLSQRMKAPSLEEQRQAFRMSLEEAE